MNGVCSVTPSSIIPGCQAKPGRASRNTPSSSAMGSARQARPRLNGPSPMATKS